MPDRQLLILDMSGIQEYILHAGAVRLKVVRGASQILNDVNTRVWRDLLRRRKTSALASNLMASAPAKRNILVGL
jgi:hypothetical protein